MEFDPVRLPQCVPGRLQHEEVLQTVESWVRSEPLMRLAEAFGFTHWDAGLAETLDLLDEFSAERWDFRRGEERNLADPATFSGDLNELIRATALALGMVTPHPARFAAYDHVLILGGLVRACILRPQYAATLLRSGIKAGEVTALGGFRELRGDEHDLAAAAGLPEVANEVEVMDAGVRTAFGLGDPIDERGETAENPNLSWIVRRYDASDVGSVVQVVAAPSRAPERRANTPDTYAFWADSLVDLKPSETVLLVTSTIYVPFQHADAIRMIGLPYDVGVDTVGVDTEHVATPHLRQTFTPANYLQEVRSAIRSMKGLYEAVRQSNG